MRTAVTPETPKPLQGDSSSEDMNVAKLLYQDHFKPTGFNEEQMKLGAFPNHDPKPFVLEQIDAIENTPRYMQYLPNS